jgi:nitroreductase
MNISDAIRLKRAVRKFAPEPLPEEMILAILNAGRRAQSSKNTQPWHFIAITDKATLQDLSECGEWAGHLAGATLGLPCFRRTRKRSSSVSSPGAGGVTCNIIVWVQDYGTAKRHGQHSLL